MSDLPQDPFMLLSYVNTQLRDNYASLNDFCSSCGADRADIEAVLSTAGFAYDEKQKRFW